MDDRWSASVKEVKASKDLSAPAANDLWFRTETTHVTEGGREEGREGGGGRWREVEGGGGRGIERELKQ